MSLIVKYNELEVHEADDGYYIYHGHDVHGMGDGVDMFLREDGEGVWPGTEEFNELMEQWLEEFYDEVLEAYFGECDA